MTRNKTISTLISVSLAAMLLMAGTTDSYAQNKLLNSLKSKSGKAAEPQKTEPAKSTKSWFDEPVAEENKAEAKAEPKAEIQKAEPAAKAAPEKTVAESKPAKVKEAKPASDNSIRILMVGNSFTYCNDSWDMLAKICASEGKKVTIVHSAEPGYAFADHLKCEATTKAILEGEYSYAILQDQSQTPAKYALNPKGNVQSRNNFITMTNRIFGWSPRAMIIVEETWAYVGDKFGGFASMTEFDNYIQNGARLYAEVIRGKVSPTGTAFATVRSERPDINLYAEDNIHPSAYGSYLKSCVNYLTIFGGKFSSSKENCGLDPEICKYLKTVAKKAVDSRTEQ